jgi:hypothetical protein
MSSLMQFLNASCKRIQTDKLITITALFIAIALTSEDYISRIIAVIGMLFVLNKDWRI